MGKKIVFLVAVLCAGLAGCASVYQAKKNPLGTRGGYWDAPGPGKLTWVVYTANKWQTSEELEGHYLMLRCAQLARQKGKPYFIMYASVRSAIADSPEYENIIITRNYGAQTAMAYVLFSDTQVPGALAADDIFRRYGAEAGVDGK